MSKIELLIIGSEESAMAIGDLGVTLSVCAGIWVVVMMILMWLWIYSYVYIFKREDFQVASDCFFKEWSLQFVRTFDCAM